MQNNNSIADEITPTQFFLSQNYPNSFREKTMIKYCVPLKTKVHIAVYNTHGKMLVVLVDEIKNPGTYEVEFAAGHSGKSVDGGKNLPDGYYFYKMITEEFSSEKKWFCINKLSERFNMKNLLQFLLFFLLTARIGFGQFESKITECRFEYPSKILSKTSFNIDSLITTTMYDYHIPGLAACIVKDGNIIWKGAYGYADIQHNKPVTDSTLFKVASLSKPIVATALMQLWENGLFDLDEDINNHLPFQVRNPFYPNDPITFRMLLTHTSSILDNPTYYPMVTWGADSPIPLDSFLVNYLVPGGIYYSDFNYRYFPPSESYGYSNIGASLIGYLVERISDIPFEQYCQDSIFIPLGMNESSWFLQNLDINHIALPYQVVIDDGDTIYQSYGHSGSPTYPAGQLKTSAVQYARHLIAFMQRGQIDGVRILESSTVDSMTTIQFPNLIEEQALIWFIDSYTVPSLGTFKFCYHSGASYGVRTLMGFMFEPNNNLGVVIFTNGEADIIKIWDALYIYANTISDIDEDFETPPEQYYLSQNYPNPFNPSTTIKYSIPEFSKVKLTLFNLLGEEVTTLVNEEKSAGIYTAEFNATTLPSGVYFYQLKAGEYTSVKKMLLIK